MLYHITYNKNLMLQDYKCYLLVNEYLYYYTIGLLPSGTNMEGYETTSWQPIRDRLFSCISGDVFDRLFLDYTVIRALSRSKLSTEQTQTKPNESFSTLFLVIYKIHTLQIIFIELSSWNIFMFLNSLGISKYQACFAHWNN